MARLRLERSKLYPQLQKLRSHPALEHATFGGPLKHCLRKDLLRASSQRGIGLLQRTTTILLLQWQVGGIPGMSKHIATKAQNHAMSIGRCQGHTIIAPSCRNDGHEIALCWIKASRRTWLPGRNYRGGAAQLQAARVIFARA